MAYTYKDVKYFIEIGSNCGCKLIDDTYENCKQVLNIQCKCTNPFQVTFDTFKNKNKRQCNQCTIKEKRKDITKVEEIIKENGYILIETKYKELSENRRKLYIHISCQNKHDSYWTSWQEFKSGSRCFICYNEKRTNKPDKWNEENIRDLIKQNNLILFDESYEFNNAKKKIKCINQDGYFVNVLINSLKQGIQPSPFKKNPYALDNLSILCNKNGLNLICDQKWKGAKNKYIAINLEGYKVLFYIDSLLNGCKPRIFHPSNTFTLQNLKHYCDINKLEYEVISNTYIKGKEHLLLKYIGNEIRISDEKRYFSVSLEKFVHGNQRHPLLSQSKGEKKTEYWLTENEISYLDQITFDDCKYKGLLKFDFAIFDKNNNLIYLIEYDGIQHFEPVEHFGGEENFEITKLRDNIKNEYCKKNNIPLLRIPYWDYDNIEQILNNFI